MIYGYTRVSTDGRSVDPQVRTLRAAAARQVFREPASGASSTTAAPFQPSPVYGRGRRAKRAG